MATKESAGDRRALAREAGFGSLSLPSILAGTLVAFGAVAAVMAVAGAVGSNIGLTTDGISTDEWRRAGVIGAVVAVIVLFVAFFFGGYAAGRMGRRAGARNGLAVFVLSAAVVAIVAGLAAWLGDSDSVRSALQDNGVPTSANTWSDIGLGAAIAATIAAGVGAVLGGIRGEQWHGRLVAAAVEHREEQGAVPATVREERRIGEDSTTVDLRDRDDDVRRAGDDGDELSVEEEREQARASHAPHHD